MAKSEAVVMAPSHIRYAVGYGLTSVWATMLLFSSYFSRGDSSAIVTLSMLSGVVACVLILASRRVFSRHCGRTVFTALCALGMAAGTLLCTMPVFNSSPVIHAAGVALSGLCAMPILLAWFSEYSLLPGRVVVFLAGCALMFAALLCFVISRCPQLYASLFVGVAPIVSFLVLPAKSTESAHANLADNLQAPVRPFPTLATLLSQAVSWRTLIGIAIVFFVMGSLGVEAPKVDLFRAELSPNMLVYPATFAVAFFVSAYLVRKRIDASIMYKVLLVALAGLLFALVFLGYASISFIFYTYIACDVLLWTVLVLASKQTPVEPFVVFIVGWLAECLGNVAGHNVAAAMANTAAFAAITGLLIIVAIGFVFSEGVFLLDLEESDQDHGEGMESSHGKAASSDADSTVNTSAKQAAVSSVVDAVGAQPAHGTAPEIATEGEYGFGSGSGSQTDAIGTFVSAHGLSKREAEVFALWVTGHGQKYIQDTLFISESTTKTHMRNIYRKCDVHNRAEIIDLFERESATMANAKPQTERLFG